MVLELQCTRAEGEMESWVRTCQVIILMHEHFTVKLLLKSAEYVSTEKPTINFNFNSKFNKHEEPLRYEFDKTIAIWSKLSINPEANSANNWLRLSNVGPVASRGSRYMIIGPV